MMERTFSSGSWAPSKTVPLRWEKDRLQVRQYTMRIRWPLPDQPRKYRLPPPRLPASGQSLFWQQKSSIGRMAPSPSTQALDGLPPSLSLPLCPFYALCLLRRDTTEELTSSDCNGSPPGSSKNPPPPGRRPRPPGRERPGYTPAQSPVNGAG